MNMPLLEEKVDRLENHFKVYKSDLTDVKEVTRDIRNLLTGTELTGKKGVVHLLERLESKVDDLEAKQMLIDDNMNNVKFVAKGVITAVIGFFIWLFQSK
jgi:DNA-directed RNA polymerase sigma subunit (sigma70/sigma32)